MLLNWYDTHDPAEEPDLSRWYTHLLQRAARMHQHVVVLDADDDDWAALHKRPQDERRIDVWWFGGDSSRLALLFAYLMTRSDAWDEAMIRLLAPAPNDSAQKMEASLRRRLDELRIEATVEVVSAEEGDAMYAQSNDASFVFLPLRLEGMSARHPTGGPVNELFPTLPVIAMVAAAGDVELTAEDDESPPTPPEADQAATDG